MEEMHHGTREFLDTVFRKMSVEKILENIRFSGSWNDSGVLRGRKPDHKIADLIEMYGIGDVFRYTNDERMLWREKYYNSKKDKCNNNNNAKEIFDILFRYADYVLKVRNGVPVCKIEQILNWNSLYSRLGQDIFTTAAICKNAIRCHIDICNFDWEAVIKTDDDRLNTILGKGLAENHYHLNGSTQSFDLSWICLMNHIQLAGRLDSRKELRKGNMVHTIIGYPGEAMSLKRKVMFAARIRSLLFQRILAMISSEDLMAQFESFYDLSTIDQCKYTINSLRMLVGTRFQQPDHRSKCIDYCIAESLYDVDASSYNRALTGERNFLYSCFRLLLFSKWGNLEASLFYAYLLLKCQFRGEWIQINQVLGFDNFSNYQDKKSSIYGDIAEYWVEAQRLGICASIEDNHVDMLEARIMPRERSEDLAKSIYFYDAYVKYAAKKQKQLEYFYVCHFPKQPKKDAKPVISMRLEPRNHITRKNARKMVFALKEFCQLYHRCSQRLFGIDACSHEIACRPEVFATEFRYLRKLNIPVLMDHKVGVYECSSDQFSIKKKDQGFSVTYHVGEDFLGICDGLRAIDEAINFLDLQRGERIGHALALGTDAERYYELKRWTIHIRKQDLLDNYVWVLNKTIEWGIELSSGFRENMRSNANMLLWEIYGNEWNLDDYYHSWKLRGDHPQLYVTKEYEPSTALFLDMNYVDCMEQAGENMTMLRKNSDIRHLVYLYYYDQEVREKGKEIDFYSVCPEYVDVVSRIQRKMLHIIAEKGIAIECNPTSNIRIGPFLQYENHPITKFNDYHLNSTSKTPQLLVSINTDDLGVFNTSLCHEYALLLEALRRRRHREGNYNDEELYDYLDYIRQNGLNMSFAYYES